MAAGPAPGRLRTDDHIDNDYAFDKDCSSGEDIESQNMEVFPTNI